jgi:hypothetical protein
MRRRATLKTIETTEHTDYTEHPKKHPINLILAKSFKKSRLGPMRLETVSRPSRIFDAIASHGADGLNHEVPYLDKAEVPWKKIVDYLLSATHRDGRHKAAFFLGFGFRSEEWEQLAAALVNQARANDVVKEEASPFGVRYGIESAIEAPDGRHPKVRSVWFIDTGKTIPRFVTAYPLKGEKHD